MKSSQRQWLITCSAIPSRTFTQLEGGEKSGDTNKWYDGGSLVPDVIGAPPEVSDITLTNAYDPDIDAAILQNLKNQISILRCTITKQALYGDMTRAPSKPDVYTNCLLKGITPPTVNANSGDTATYQLIFAPADLT